MMFKRLLILFSVHLSLASAVAQPALPITEIHLYKNGMAQVSRSGRIDQPTRLSFQREDLKDILKSLIAWNPESGQLYSIGYTSGIPFAHLLKRFPFDLHPEAGLVGFLRQVRGAELSADLGGRSVQGKLVSIDRVTRKDAKVVDDHRITVASPEGSLFPVWLSDVSSIRLMDAQLNQHLTDYLQILGEGGQESTADVTFYPGPSAGQMRVAYVQQFPLWKTSYRLDLGEESRIQGWAQIDNPTGEAWENVQLSLISGAPVSFVMDLFSPLFATRQSVPVPGRQVAGPIIHEGAVARGRVPAGANAIYGTVQDSSGAALPGATILLRHNSGQVRQITSDDSGYFEVSNLAPGYYDVTAQLVGFASASQSTQLPVGGRAQVQLFLEVGSVSEAVTMEAGLGRAVMKAPPPPRAAPPQSAPISVPEARSEQIQDYFEYRFPFPVTLASRESALLPFLSRSIQADRVSVYNSRRDPQHAYNAARLENTSGLPLEAGPLTIFQDGRYAGEAIVEYLNRGEERLISYGIDYETAISQEGKAEPARTVQVKADRGLLIATRESSITTSYRIKSNSNQAKTILLEHPREDSRKLKGAEPAETTPGFHRFLVEVQPRQQVDFPVIEVVSQQASVHLLDSRPERLRFFFQGEEIPAGLLAALRPIHAAQAELSQLEQELQKKGEQIEGIVEGQERIRENLKVLGRNSEEKQLAQRYVRQLSEQEDQLARLIEEGEALRERVEAQQRELNRLVSEFTWESARQ